jgi:transposase
MKMFGATLDAVAIPRPSPKKTPRQHLCCDKGYDYPELRRSAARRGYVAHIKSRGQEEQERRKNPRFKARRWVVERTNRWHNLFRRLKIRYEVHAENYLGFVQFAITPAVHAALQRKEGYPHRYQEILVTVEIPQEHKTVTAITYAVTDQHRLPFDLPVRPEYRETILQGAQDFRFSRHYQRQLHELLGVTD